MKKKRWCVKNLCGYLAVVIVYLAFLQIYTLILIFPIVKGIQEGDVGDWINLFVFTFLTILTLICHI